MKSMATDSTTVATLALFIKQIRYYFTLKTLDPTLNLHQCYYFHVLF